MTVDLSVRGTSEGHQLAGEWDGLEAANAFLRHLVGRAFSPATVRAYAFDLLNFARFLLQEGVLVAAVTPADVFAWVDWQAAPPQGRGERVVARRPTGTAPATVNRRVAAVRAFFEHQVMTGVRADNPVPAPRRGQGLGPTSRGLLGPLGPGRSAAAGGWCASSGGFQ